MTQPEGASSARVRPAAVLWDMDGTLVDTEPYWIETEIALATEHGATWSHQDGLALVGQDLLTSARTMRERMGITLSPEAIVERLLDGVVARVQQGVPWRPGARELLADLGEQGVPCALVTMSWTRLAAPILAALPEGTFAAVVTGDVVEHGKPHPEPYLTAARMLGVAAGDCLAIEDSATGALSAESAGCTVLVVPHQVEVPTGARRVFVEGLTGLAASELRLLPDRDVLRGAVR